MLSCRSTAFYSTFSFFFNHTAPTEIYTLSLHDALPIFLLCEVRHQRRLESLERIGLERLVAPVPPHFVRRGGLARSEEHTSELQSRGHLVCRLLLEKKKKQTTQLHLVNQTNQL